MDTRTPFEKLAQLASVNLIWVASSEADMGSVSGTMFDALGEVYELLIELGDGLGESYSTLAEEYLEARKQMRQAEWGNDFEPSDYDLPLDKEWRE